MTTTSDMPADPAVAAACEELSGEAAPVVNSVAAEPVAVGEAVCSSAAGTPANEIDPVHMMVDEKLVKEEEAARVDREKHVKSKPAQALTKDRLAKLDVLLDKAQMYSLFLVEQVTSMKEQLEQARLPPACISSSVWHLQYYAAEKTVEARNRYFQLQSLYPPDVQTNMRVNLIWV